MARVRICLDTDSIFRIQSARQILGLSSGPFSHPEPAELEHDWSEIDGNPCDTY